MSGVKRTGGPTMSPSSFAKTPSSPEPRTTTSRPAADLVSQATKVALPTGDHPSPVAGALLPHEAQARATGVGSLVSGDRRSIRRAIVGWVEHAQEGDAERVAELNERVARCLS